MGDEEFVSRPFDRFQRSEKFEFARLDDGNIVGDSFDLGDLVTGEEDGAAGGDVVDHRLEEFASYERVEAGGWFVEDEERWFVGHRQAEGDFGTHPFGEVFDLLSEVDAVAGHPGVVSFAEAGSVEAGGEPAGLVDGHPVVQRRFVGHVADDATDISALRLRGVLKNFRSTRRRLNQSHKDGDGGGFACSVFAEKGDDASCFSLHRQGFESGFVTVGFGS